MANPLDKALREFARPVLSEAGYEWKNRRYWKVAESGDAVGVEFQATQPSWGVAACYINLAYVTAARRDELIERGRHDGSPTYGSLTMQRLQVPRSMVSETLRADQWEVFPTRHGIDGAELERGLREFAIPRLDQLLDRRAAIDRFVHPADTMVSAWSNWASFFWVLIDEGPSMALSHTWARLEGREYFADDLQWGRARLARRFGSDALNEGRPVAGARPRPAVDALTQGPIAAVLTDAGYVLDNEVFRRYNDLGDQLVVQVREAFTSTEDDPQFSIDCAVVPHLLWDWLQAHPRRANEDVPYVADGWFQRRIAPPLRDSRQNSRDGLFDLELWSANGDQAEVGERLATTLRRELVEAEHLLDRSTLWTRCFGADVPFGQPGQGYHGGNRFILTMDLDPMRLRRELDDAAAAGVRIAIDDDEAWARTWLDTHSGQ